MCSAEEIQAGIQGIWSILESDSATKDTYMKRFLAPSLLVAAIAALAVPVTAQQFVSTDPFSTPPGSPALTWSPPSTMPGAGTQATGNVTIIESQSTMAAHDMDAEWLSVATAMGFTAGIYPQSTLESKTFYTTTDILVVSSGIIGLSSNAVVNIEDFLREGGQVYLQGEYLTSYSTNIAFAAIVNIFSGGFTWGGTTSGDLQPMNISGACSTTPNSVPSIGYHWYGAWGTAGALVTPFMHFGGQDFGWLLEVPGGGKMVHNTDQDWVRVTTSPALMENILTYLNDVFRISVAPDPIQGGTSATLTAERATPLGRVIAAYSLTGSGPHNTIFGPVDLSPPIYTLPTMTADANGVASHTQTVPNALGVTVWIQAVDITSGDISNLLTQVIS